MALLEKMLGGTIRKEMKARVDEVIEAGNRWNKTAEDLTTALNKLSATIEAGKVDKSQVEEIVSGSKILAKDTKNLTKAFFKYDKTLNKLASSLT